MTPMSPGMILAGRIIAKALIEERIGAQAGL
jgi:hypothetical protein